MQTLFDVLLIGILVWILLQFYYRWIIVFFTVSYFKFSEETKTEKESYFWSVNKFVVRLFGTYKQQPGAPQEECDKETQFSRSMFEILAANFRSLIERVVSKSRISRGINSIGHGHLRVLSKAICRHIIAKTDRSLEMPKISSISRFSSRSPFPLSSQYGP